MTDNKNNIGSPGECCSFEQLRAYADGRLNREETRYIEEHLADCDLCSDIVDGLMSMPANLNLDVELAAINSNIDKAVEKKRKGIALFNPRKLRFVAAAVLVTLAISSVIMINYKIHTPLYSPTQFSKLEKPQEESSKENSNNHFEFSEKDAIAQNLPAQEPAPAFGGSPLGRVSPPSSKGFFFDSIVANDEINLAYVDDITTDAEEQSPKSNLDGMFSPPETTIRDTPATGAGANTTKAGNKKQERKAEKKDVGKSAESNKLEENAPTITEIIVVDNDKLVYEEECIEPISFTVVEVKPEFPGGVDALMQFIADNVQYPKEAVDSGIQGTIYVQFVISNEGKVTQVQLIKGITQSLDDEAIRVIKMMPDWRPGKQRSKKVSVTYIMPIKFSLN